VGLQAHCYRMLGSIHDAEDALQDTLLRAWRGLAGFDGRSKLSSWLYRIATNTCLTHLEHRRRRTLPIHHGAPSADPDDAVGPPLVESVWIEPGPDEAFGLDDAIAGPAARYEQRESVELAIVAALQHLPPSGRAALLLTDVLGYSAREAAAMLGTTTAALNSALQRARRAIDERVPEQSQQASLRALGDAELDAAVEAYLRAMEAADVEAVVDLLTADATWSMPPQPAWFRGHDAIAGFLREHPFRWFRWRLRRIAANGQPALACWSWDDDGGRWRAHAINVLGFRGGRIAEVCSFLDVTRRGVTGPGFTDFADDRLFERFGVPSELPA